MLNLPELLVTTNTDDYAMSIASHYFTYPIAKTLEHNNVP